MDFDPNLTVDNLVPEETKEDRISVWDNIFRKYERISKESTNIINVKDIEKVYGNDTDFNILKSGIVKKKRDRSRSRKINRKNKRTKVLKLDDNLKSVVNDVSSASNVGLHLPNCVNEELVPEVTEINSIEELRSHHELVANLTNHKVFEYLSENDSSAEILMEDNPSECNLIDHTNVVNVQDNTITHLLSPNVKQIQVDEIVSQPDNSINIVSDWLNKTEPFQKCIHSKHNDVVYFKEPVDSKTKLNNCNGKYKNQDTKKELFSKRISARSQQVKVCGTCNNHKSPKEVDSYVIKQTNVGTNNSLNHNGRNISKNLKSEDLSNEALCSGRSLQDRLGEESLCNGISAKCKQVEVCYSKQESGEKSRINETYNFKSDSDISNFKTSQEECMLNLEIKSDDVSAKHETDDENLQNLERRKFLMAEIFYKRSKRSKAFPVFKEVDISSTKHNNAELVNCIEKLKSESKATSSAKILEEGHFNNKMHESNSKIEDHGLVKNKERTLAANNLNGFGQLDEGFRSSSPRKSLSKASHTSTPIKNKDKSPIQNKDEENYLNIKNKIENKLKSNLGYMAYQRYKLHQNPSNKKEKEFWENNVRKEIQKLSRVIPSALLLRYMKEYINLRNNLSG